MALHLVSRTDLLDASQDASFDCIVAADVLEHVPRPDLTLPAISRVLKPSGTLVVSLPTENRLYKFVKHQILRRPHGADHHIQVPQDLEISLGLVFRCNAYRNLFGFFPIIR